MALCALKIGNHVWKVVGRNQHDQFLVEAVPRLVALEDGTFADDLEFESRMIFTYVGTNKTGVKEYHYVTTVKAHREGRQEQAEASQGASPKGQEAIHLYRVP